MVESAFEHLHWKKDLELGIDAIDSQHKKIVDYINELVDAANVGNAELVDGVAVKLLEYIPTHFAFEEKLQRLAAFHDIHAHQTVHQIFIHRLQIYERRVNRGEDISEGLVKMLKSWFVKHIQEEDRIYVRSMMKALKNQKIQAAVQA